MGLVLCTTEWKDGFTPNGHVDNLFWMEREEAETNENFRQVIPYCVLRHGALVYAYRRKGAEKRLHGLWSIGVGGHVDHPETIVEARDRELKEEVEIGCPYSVQYIGTLALSETPVDRVHIGMVYVLELKHPWAGPGAFYLEPPEPLEGWSKFLWEEVLLFCMFTATGEEVL